MLFISEAWENRCPFLQNCRKYQSNPHPLRWNKNHIFHRNGHKFSDRLTLKDLGAAAQLIKDGFSSNLQLQRQKLPATNYAEELKLSAAEHSKRADVEKHWRFSLFFFTSDLLGRHKDRFLELRTLKRRLLRHRGELAVAAEPWSLESRRTRSASFLVNIGWLP